MEFNASTTSSQSTAMLALLTSRNAPRALLVSLDRHGNLAHQEVNDGQSVVNLHTELFDHLSSAPQTDEFLAELRDYCAGRLAARAETKACGGFSTPRADGGWNITHTSIFEPLTFRG